MDDSKIDDVLSSLRAEYESNGLSVKYDGSIITFGSDDAFEWWLFRLERDLLSVCDG